MPFYALPQPGQDTAKIPLLYPIVVACFLLYLLFSPVYLFPSGTPQIADFIMAFGILLYIAYAFSVLPFTAHVRFPMVYVAGATFALYTFCINVIYYMFYFHYTFLFSSLYYVYNFLVFVIAARLYAKMGEGLIRMTFWVVVGSIILQAAFFFSEPFAGRMTGSFHNPNQLAYWGLLTISVIIVLKRDEPLGFKELAMVVACSLFILGTLSKAASFTLPILLAIAIFKKSSSSYVRLFLTLFVFAGLATFLASDPRVQYAIENLDLIERLVSRLETTGVDSDDSVEGRGYDRIYKFPEYLALGAGEGGYFRFVKTSKAIELHSSLATILFCYGIVGFIMFATFIYLVFRNTNYECWLILLVLFTFGTTHQGLRFTLFWILLALILTLAKSKRDSGYIEDVRYQ